MNLFFLLIPFIHALFLPFTQPSQVLIGLHDLNFLNPPYALAATYSVSGRVTVPGCIGTPGCIGGYANIHISASGPSFGSALTSGTGGGYSIGGLKAGTYSVMATPPTCLSGGGSASVKLGPGNGSANFSMLPKTETLTVTVTNSTTGAGISGVPISLGYGGGGSTGGGGVYSFSHSCTTSSDTVSITVPAGYKAVSATSQSFADDANATVNFSLEQLNMISGTVYDDVNENKNLDAGESGYQGITVKITNSLGTQTTTSDINGNYSFFVDPTAGNSTVAISGMPAGWFNTTPTSQTVASNVNTAGLKFGIALYNTISGNVFFDSNKDGLLDNAETNYTTPPFSISITPPAGTITTDATTGTYTITNLLPGTYTVSYLSLPSDYYLTTPLNGPPPSYTVTVGPGCSVNGAPGAVCQ